MADTVRIFFDRVWSRGEVQLLNELLTDDFVWKVKW
jgi:ketosteroid isomerase-like protein